jgi:hypothetical protein
MVTEVGSPENFLDHRISKGSFLIKKKPLIREVYFLPRIGLEPTRLAAPEPKSGMSTNFTIWAKGTVYIFRAFRSILQIISRPFSCCLLSLILSTMGSPLKV